MSIKNADVINDANNEHLCRASTKLILAGLVIATLSGLFFVMALISISNETEGDGYVIIMPQIGGMIVGTVMAGVGYCLRHRHCV